MLEVSLGLEWWEEAEHKAEEEEEEDEMLEEQEYLEVRCGRKAFPGEA
jgi:hypothetical protein